MKLPNLADLGGAECCYCGKPAEQVKSKLPWELAEAAEPFSYLCARCAELHAKAMQDFSAKLLAMAASGELAGQDGDERVEVMLREMEQRLRDQAGRD